MPKIISLSLYSFILLIITISVISCGIEELDTSVENRTSTSTSFSHTKSDGTTETLSWETPLELDGIGSTPLAFSVVDINGDSREDIILLNNSDGSPAIQILTRTDTITSTNASDLFTIQSVSINKTPQHLIVQDVNGDGTVDVVVAHRAEDKLSYWTGQLSGTSYSLSASATEITVGDFPIFIAAADFEASGTTGIAVVNYSSTHVSVVSNLTNSSSITVADSDVVATTTIQIVTGEWSGDSCPDIAVLNNAANKVYIYKGTSCGTTTVAFEKIGEEADLQSSPQAIISGDWDNDGNTDLAVTNGASDSLSILYGNGSGDFDVVAIGVGKGPSQLTATDLNSDGVVDFIVGNTTDRDLTILVSNGLASRQTTSNNIYNRGDITTGLTPTGSRPSFIKAVDINSDGKDDIVLTLPFINKLSILLRK